MLLASPRNEQDINLMLAGRRIDSCISATTSIGGHAFFQREGVVMLPGTRQTRIRNDTSVTPEIQ